jgi:thymidylate synthase (FAD)
MIIEIVEPSVELLTPVDQLLTYPDMIERACRTCYASEDKIKEGSADSLISRCIKSRHHSILEHCVVSYRFICSRACSHQLVRSRIASFSQASQRYIDSQKRGMQVIVPPKIKNSESYAEFVEMCQDAYDNYVWLRNAGVLPEDARFLLPNACATNVFTTMNLRAWRHFIEIRGLNLHAQWEIRQLALNILYELNTYVPVFFRDLVEELAQRKTKETSNG